MKPIKVSRSSVRRFLLEKQGLIPSIKNKARNDNPLETVENVIKKLECVQLDPVSVVEKNQHLVLAARINGYEPEHLNALLANGSIFEYWANAACAIPMDDYPIFKPIRKHRFNQVKNELESMNDVVKAIMTRLDTEGALPSRAFKAKTKVHGYWDNQTAKTKATSHALNLLLDADIIRVVKRSGNERFFGVTQHTLPKQLLNRAHAIDYDSAREALINKYIRAYRVVDPRDSRFGWIKMTARERQSEVELRVKEGFLVPLEVADINRQYYVLEEDLDHLVKMSRFIPDEAIDKPITFLPPLDNLLWRRERIEAFFDFDYKWEIYTPQSKRRYGPYAMPILYGSQLIGRLDPLLDRKNNKFIARLLQLEPEVKATTSLKRSLREALTSFADFHHAKDIEVQTRQPSELPI